VPFLSFFVLVVLVCYLLNKSYKKFYSQEKQSCMLAAIMAWVAAQHLIVVLGWVLKMPEYYDTANRLNTRWRILFFLRELRESNKGLVDGRKVSQYPIWVLSIGSWFGTIHSCSECSERCTLGMMGVLLAASIIMSIVIKVLCELRRLMGYHMITSFLQGIKKIFFFFFFFLYCGVSPIYDICCEITPRLSRFVVINHKLNVLP